MKRFAVFVSLCALMLAPVLALAASETSIRWKRVPITWVTNSATATNGGRIDSTAITITGIPTTASIDTTAWIDISNWAWGHGSQQSLSTAFHEAKLIIWGSSITSVDSLPVAIDYKIDGATYSVETTGGVICLSSAAGVVDGLLASNVLSSVSGGAPGGAIVLFGAQQIRFRVVCDGNSGARLFGAKAEFIYPVYDPPSVNRRIEWRTVPVPWAVQRVGFANGELAPVDSARSIAGAAQAVDTTAWLSLENVDWSAGSQATMQTAYGIIRLHATIGTNTSVDTLFYFGDFAMEAGGTRYSQATANTLLSAAADAAILGNGMSTDIDATPATTQVPWGAKAMRLRVRADGNTASLAAGVRIWATLPFLVE